MALSVFLIAVFVPVSMSGAQKTEWPIPVEPPNPDEITADQIDPQADPEYESYFNCWGPWDKCGRPLTSAQSGNADYLRTQLQRLDEAGLDRSEQIEFMKKKFGDMVVGNPEYGSMDYYLVHLVPPAFLFLGLLFTGGIGYYWVQIRSDQDEV